MFWLIGTRREVSCTRSPLSRALPARCRRAYAEARVVGKAVQGPGDLVTVLGCFCGCFGQSASHAEVGVCGQGPCGVRVLTWVPYAKDRAQLADGLGGVVCQGARVDILHDLGWEVVQRQGCLGNVLGLFAAQQLHRTVTDPVLLVGCRG